MGKHRIDALTDGIFAVAMTLRTIKLKIYVPEAGNSAFMLMLIVGPIARRLEAKYTLSRNETRTLSI